MTSKLKLLFLTILLNMISLNALSNNISLEKQKFEFEKFNEERKANYDLIKSGIAAISLLIPLLLGIYTIRSQAKSARELKKIEAENLFALKAAEIVMSVKNPFAIKNKAEVLLAIFKDQLPKNFVSSFEPEKHSKPGPSVESKLELLRMINENPNREKDIVELWLRMFPHDTYQKLFPGDKE